MCIPQITRVIQVIIYCCFVFSADDDFEPIYESVTFEPDVFLRSVSVTIVNDDIREETEEFTVG